MTGLNDWLDSLPNSGPELQKPAHRGENPDAGQCDLAEVREVLSYVSPDLPEPEWTDVGRALHDKTGGGAAGLEIFDSWSSAGTKYRGREDVESKYRRFTLGGGTTFATVCEMAKRAGANLAAIRRKHRPGGAGAGIAQQSVSRQQESPAEQGIQGLQRMAAEQFPDVISTASGTCRKLGTIPNIAALLAHYGITTHYDVIGKRARTVIPGASGTPDNSDNSAITRIISLAKLNELPADTVPQYLQVLADENPENPVADWIYSEEWDGVDRLPDIYETLQVKPDYPKPLRDVLVYRWLISAVAAAIMPAGFSARGVLTFQGGQGIGKTSWLRSLVPDPQLAARLVKIDHLLDPASKDSVLGAVTHWLVEIGELDGSFRKADVSRIKGFLTAPTDKVRRPYERAESEFQRRTVFFASVNDTAFLVDETGNTRFWTISLEAVDFRHGINMQQLWRQVAGLYESGEQWWLTPEEEHQLAQVNQGHRVVSSIREMMVSRLDFDAVDESEKLTSSEVLIRIGFDRPTNAQAREAGVVLRELFGEPTRSKGVSRWSVPPVIVRGGQKDLL